MTRWVHCAALLLVAASLTACTPRYQPAGPPVQEPTLGETVAEMADGARLRLSVTAPTAPQRLRAVVIALHGINDHGGSWDEPAGWWADEGIMTYAPDQRGFGANSNPGIWPTAATLIADLRTLIALVRERHPDLPIFLVGESMGSAVIMAALGEADAPAVDGAVLGAPAVWARPTMSGTYQRLLAGFRQLVPGLVLTGSGLGRLASDNIAMLRGLGRDPLVIKGARVDAIAGLVDLMDRAYHAAPAIRTPLLLLYGERDEIVPRHAVALTAARFTNDPLVAIYPKGWHLIYRDLNSAIVLNDVRHWMLKGGSGLPSSAHQGGPELLGEGRRLAGLRQQRAAK